MPNQSRIKRYRSMTLQEIANQMGVDVSYIHAVEYSAMNKLKRSRKLKELWEMGDWRRSNRIGTLRGDEV